MNRFLNEINNLAGNMDRIYHEASLKIGLSDSELDMFYVISIFGNGCNQSVLYKESGLRRSTVNTSIRRLEKQGILYLAAGEGRNTRVYLTDKGMEYLHKVEKFMDFEKEIYSSWTEEKRTLFLNLTRRYVEELDKKLEEL